MMALGDEKTKINNALPVAREGLPFIFLAAGLTFVFLLGGLLFLAILAGVLGLFMIYFFRDPKRENKVQDKTIILAPADGRVLDIQRLEDHHNTLGGSAIRIGIFMSLLSVHVNRIPVTGRISKITYHPGRFFSANRDKASKHNENNQVTLQTNDGRKIVFIQVAGLIARRIVCWVKEGDHVLAGQRFGLIRFGSRLEVYLPDDSRITVQLRDKVKAGETILGYLR